MEYEVIKGKRKVSKFFYLNGYTYEKQWILLLFFIHVFFEVSEINSDLERF